MIRNLNIFLIFASVVMLAGVYSLKFSKGVSNRRP